MKKFLPVLVFTFFVSVSCTPAFTKNEVWQNDKIDPKVKAEMTGFEKQVYGYMCDNNYQPLSQLFSDTLLSLIGPDFSQKFMPQIQRLIKGKQYKVFDEFYIRNVKPVDTVNITAGKGENAYTIKFMSAAPETYVAMLIAGDSVNEVMITLICNNIKGKWKLSHLMGEDYSLNTRNTIEQFNYAKTLEKNNDLIDAVNTMGLATHCNAPGGNIFRYDNAAAMNKYSDSLANITKAKYPFPYTVDEMLSKPTIFNVHFETFDHHLDPMVMYLSSIKVADTVALKKENDEMQQKIGAIFYGMDKSNRAILYRAYNDQPDGRNNPAYYGYIQKIR